MSSKCINNLQTPERITQRNSFPNEYQSFANVLAKKSSQKRLNTISMEKDNRTSDALSKDIVPLVDNEEIHNMPAMRRKT